MEKLNLIGPMKPQTPLKSNARTFSFPTTELETKIIVYGILVNGVIGHLLNKLPNSLNIRNG